MAKKVGTLIKEARTSAGLTQEQLARKIKGLSAAELGKAERGETDLSQVFLKEIAKATGVTQTSLLTAAKESGASAKKTETAKKTNTAQKTAAKKTETAKKTDTAKKTTTGKKTSNKKTDDELTAAEKKLLEAYRSASADAKKNALKLLKGEDLDFADIMKLLKLDSKLDSIGSGNGILGGLKEGLLDGILGKK